MSYCVGGGVDVESIKTGEVAHLCWGCNLVANLSSWSQDKGVKTVVWVLKLLREGLDLDEREEA